MLRVPIMFAHGVSRGTILAATLASVVTMIRVSITFVNRVAPLATTAFILPNVAD